MHGYNNITLCTLVFCNVQGVWAQRVSNFFGMNAALKLAVAFKMRVGGAGH